MVAVFGLAKCLGCFAFERWATRNTTGECQTLCEGSTFYESNLHRYLRRADAPLDPVVQTIFPSENLARYREDETDATFLTISLETLLHPGCHNQNPSANIVYVPITIDNDSEQGIKIVGSDGVPYFLYVQITEDGFYAPSGLAMPINGKDLPTSSTSVPENLSPIEADTAIALQDHIPSYADNACVEEDLSVETSEEKKMCELLYYLKMWFPQQIDYVETCWLLHPDLIGNWIAVLESFLKYSSILMLLLLCVGAIDVLVNESRSEGKATWSRFLSRYVQQELAKLQAEVDRSIAVMQARIRHLVLLKNSLLKLIDRLNETVSQQDTVIHQLKVEGRGDKQEINRLREIIKQQRCGPREDIEFWRDHVAALVRKMKRGKSSYDETVRQINLTHKRLIKWSETQHRNITDLRERLRDSGLIVGFQEKRIWALIAEKRPAKSSAEQLRQEKDVVLAAKTAVEDYTDEEKKEKEATLAEVPRLRLEASINAEELRLARQARQKEAEVNRELYSTLRSLRGEILSLEASKRRRTEDLKQSNQDSQNLWIKLNYVQNELVTSKCKLDTAQQEAAKVLVLRQELEAQAQSTQDYLRQLAVSRFKHDSEMQKCRDAFKLKQTCYINAETQTAQLLEDIHPEIGRLSCIARARLENLQTQLVSVHKKLKAREDTQSMLLTQVRLQQQRVAGSEERVARSEKRAVRSEARIIKVGKRLARVNIRGVNSSKKAREEFKLLHKVCQTRWRKWVISRGKSGVDDSVGDANFTDSCVNADSHGGSNPIRGSDSDGGSYYGGSEYDGGSDHDGSSEHEVDDKNHVDGASQLDQTSGSSGSSSDAQLLQQSIPTASVETECRENSSKKSKECNADDNKAGEPTEGWTWQFVPAPKTPLFEAAWEATMPMDEEKKLGQSSQAESAESFKVTSQTFYEMLARESNEPVMEKADIHCQDTVRLAEATIARQDSQTNALERAATNIPSIGRKASTENNNSLNSLRIDIDVVGEAPVRQTSAPSAPITYDFRQRQNPDALIGIDAESTHRLRELGSQAEALREAVLAEPSHSSEDAVLTKLKAVEKIPRLTQKILKDSGMGLLVVAIVKEKDGMPGRSDAARACARAMLTNWRQMFQGLKVPQTSATHASASSDPEKLPRAANETS